MNKYIQFIQEVKYIVGSESKKMPLMVLFFIFSSFLDVIGIGLIAPYISLIVNPEGFLQGSFNVHLAPIMSWAQIDNMLIFIGIILIVIFFFRMIAVFLINRMIIKFSYEKGTQIRAVLMDSYQNLSYIDHLKRNSSQSKHAILSLSVEFANNTLQSILRLISEGIVVIAIVLYLFWTSGIEIGIFIFIFGIVFYVYDAIFRHRLVVYGKSVNDNSKQLIQGVDEAIDGLKEIRVLKKESYFYNKVVGASKNISDASVISSIIKLSPRYLIEFLIMLFVVSLVYVSILFDRNMVGLAATLGVFGVAALRLIPSINQILNGFMQLNNSRNAVSLLSSDLKSLKEEDYVEKKYKQTNCIALRNITLKNVDYTYPDTDQKVLNNISMSINAGDSIGLIGRSGSGKSTLIDLLLGFLEADSGELLVNNELLNTNIGAWRDLVAYLPQQIFLTDNTMKANIALGVENHQIDNQKIAQALEKSKLTNFVQSLPDGVETTLGEKGVRLSGGQRQRVALARAFYHDRDVLVMDESTSALDNETESEIIREVKQLKGIKTVIVIAHRLTTLKYCDCIYRLDNGKIVEYGSYNSIINKHNA